MGFIASNTPEWEYVLFPYQEAHGQFSSYFCLVRTQGMHPCIRTDRYDDSGNCQQEYEMLFDDEFTELVSKAYPGCKKDPDYKDWYCCDTLLVLKSMPWEMSDEICIDRKSNQRYREITWVWGPHFGRGGRIYVPISSDEARKLAENAHCEGCSEAGRHGEKAAQEDAGLLGEDLEPNMKDITEDKLVLRVDCECGATQGKSDLAACGDKNAPDTVHEMAKDEVHRGRGLKGLLKRYFK